MTVDIAFAPRPGPSPTTRPTARPTDRVFRTWCRLTGTDPAAFDPDQREAFDARPQVAALAAAPEAVLVDAGTYAVRRGSLPLERWWHAVQTLRPGR